MTLTDKQLKRISKHINAQEKPPIEFEEGLSDVKRYISENLSIQIEKVDTITENVYFLKATLLLEGNPISEDSVLLEK
jgi:hypothetical protein